MLSPSRGSSHATSFLIVLVKASTRESFSVSSDTINVLAAIECNLGCSPGVPGGANRRSAGAPRRTENRCREVLRDWYTLTMTNGEDIIAYGRRAVK